MKEVKELESLIKKHKILYYQGRPEISDPEYDKLEDQLRKLDPQNPTLALVGTSPKGAEKIKHDAKMLSLNKTYELKELMSWKGEEELLGTLKIDGVSCSLIYEEGKLLLAKTRGDGSFGEEITKKVAWMDSVPKRISLEGRVEVRGELFCREEDFFKLSDEMVSLGLERPTSQRNIVAGLMSRKDRSELSRFVEFYGFELIGAEKHIKKESDKFKLLKKQGFSIPEYDVVKDEKEIIRVINEAREFMAEGDFQIDGLVFTLNNIELHQELGYTSHHPRYRIAFKFAGESKTTKILEILWSVSRNGVLTPVATVSPVELSGAMISRVTLHNLGMVKQFQLKKGDEIEIIRSGEVIPKFLSVVKSSEEPFVLPSKGCNHCIKDLEVREIRLVCINKVCPLRDKEGILNFIQKIGIDDLSSKRLDELISQGLVSSIPDLYDLTEEKLMKLDKVKQKLADKLVRNIKKSKGVSFTVFLSSLGINGGAYNKCEKVVQSGYDTIEKIMKLTVEELSTVEGFAEKSATEFLRSIHEKRKLIKELEKKGFIFEERVVVETPMKGKKVCITGALSEKRSIIEERLRSFGAIIVGSVSKNTDYLLTNEDPGSSSKYLKAVEHNIPIVTEEKLRLLLKEGA